MRILFVAPHLPFPLRTGSSIIAYNYIQQLTRRHSVHLIAFRTKNQNDYGDLAQLCERIDLIDHPSRMRVLINALLGIPYDLPFPVSHYLSARSTHKVEGYLAHGGYDVALFQLIEMAQYRPTHYTGATLLCLEDPLAFKYLRKSPWGNSLYARILTKYEIGRILRYEQKHAKRFSRTILLNPTDMRNYENAFRDVKLDWVPYGIDADMYTPDDNITRREGMIILTGNMNHPVNIDAVDYFCAEVFPLILQQLPSANLCLVGANPSNKVMRWGSRKNTIVTGSVPDMRDYLRQAMVSVCPIKYDFGSRTKILEALACGTPVVTTVAANTGVGATPERDLYTVDSSLKFADRVVSLLRRERWTELAHNGRQFILEHRTWQKCVASLESIMEKTVVEESHDKY